MTRTKIPWTRGDDGSAGFTWNPVTGCSAQCPYCYARRMAKRLKAMNSPRYANGFAPTFHPEALSEPLHWRKPRRVFVCSMGDLFDPAITDEQIAAVFGVMAACPQHTFQVLTKQAKQMREWFARYEGTSGAGASSYAATMQAVALEPGTAESSVNWYEVTKRQPWPLPNVTLMVTAENQATADERIPHLLATPAAVRGVSLEPLLRPVDLEDTGAMGCSCIYQERGEDRCTGQCVFYRNAIDKTRRLDWVIVGADSTRGADEMPEDWVRDLRDQCVAADVPFFYKQRIVGGKRIEVPELDGRQWVEFPEVQA